MEGKREAPQPRPCPSSPPKTTVHTNPSSLYWSNTAERWIAAKPMVSFRRTVCFMDQLCPNCHTVWAVELRTQICWHLWRAHPPVRPWWSPFLCAMWSYKSRLESRNLSLCFPFSLGFNHRAETLQMSVSHNWFLFLCLSEPCICVDICAQKCTADWKKGGGSSKVWGMTL